MKAAPEHHSLAKLAVVQHLRSCGIKIKHWNSKQRPDTGKSPGILQSEKVFGVPLHALPFLYLPQYGNIPVILIDICKYLEKHSHTEGIFRKSGSVVRQKLLKTKLDNRENCLSTALPCDVAGALKQFFRELPEPILPTDLHEAFFKAQNLGTAKERMSATMLVSCLIPEKNIHVLRYFFSFLHTIASRSDVNKMDSSNIAVIFAPNLLQSNEDGEKISANTEKKLRMQAAIVQILIEQAADIGCVPDFILEKIPGMLGVDFDGETPGPDTSEDGDGISPGERKRRKRRSVGALSSMVTPFILTPSSKRKLPADSMQGISTKKRRSIKHNLGFELLPSSLFGGGSTPASAGCNGSPCISLENLQNSLSPSVTGTKHPSSSGHSKRSKRYENRKVQRVESGKTGCFSPKISRTEMVRRSLRLRFSLSKSSKEVSTSGFPSSSRSQNIGWRLANSQELNVVTGNDKVDTPPMLSPFVSAGSKKCKSEENLLTPNLSDVSSHCMSWTGSQPLELNGVIAEMSPLTGYLCTVNCYSEPVLVTGKPPAMPTALTSLADNYMQDINSKEDSLSIEDQCCAKDTVLRITKAFAESEGDLHLLVNNKKLPVEDGFYVNVKEPEKAIGLNYGEHTFNLEKSITTALENSPACKTAISGEGEDEITVNKFVTETKCCKNVSKQTLDKCSYSNESADLSGATETIVAKAPAVLPQSKEITCIPEKGEEISAENVSEVHPTVPTARRLSRVSDHIQRFNKLCLSDCGIPQKPKSPLKFQRTPVRQSVRRINSLSVQRQNMASPIVKSVSCCGSLSSEHLLINSKSSFCQETQPSFNREARSLKNNSCPLKSVLEDLTNQDIPRLPCKKPAPINAALAGRACSRYKGSPKNPITRKTFLPSSKPLDL
ncbi:hypothetical protein GDO86_016288 [Hymenochirus boettgeri]|uniref:Rho-GAP domain-containing protein n=1 Tax=Hymenochirus boettgeri TaxID=247094 RepID=A0A8T2K1U1_9PIPI|nr:hypothetical protein GDO86_016288 [Hymenochirus boettgeri]